jgi:hypothetical protein
VERARIEEHPCFGPAAPMPANFGIAAPEPLSGARCLWEDNGAGPWTERAD